MTEMVGAAARAAAAAKAAALLREVAALGLLAHARAVAGVVQRRRAVELLGSLARRGLVGALALHAVRVSRIVLARLALPGARLARPAAGRPGVEPRRPGALAAMAGTAVTGDGMAGMAFERLRGALPLGVDRPSARAPGVLRL
ncbi:hypothetical protein [Bordetella pertussis]|uniref:hypothetical protein n=1 Tax=Bordetella pertussis TaxID=520 RepID=UPI0036703A45